ALRTTTTAVVADWQTRKAQRLADGLPTIEGGIPLLIKIDPSLDLDELRHFFQFEIVSEQEDGFVIVASEDISLTSFQQKLNDFATAATGSANVAKIHELREDPTQEERLRRILTDTLFNEWPTLADDQTYICDVSVSCAGTWQIPKKPKRGRLTDEKWARKEAEWSQSRTDAYDNWDGLKDERLDSIRGIIGHYQGEILLNVDDAPVAAPTLPDSFTLRLKLPAKGLKDLVLNYPYIFEVAEPDDIELPQEIARELREIRARLEIQPPDTNAPAVCVIDSGIQEEHFLLEPGIDKQASHCFLPRTSATDVADYVRHGGHGTRVAGAVLHGEGITTEGKVSLECWVQNARVLDANCNLPQELFPPALLREIVKRYHEGKRRTRIFNHSINADAACRTRHMSAWATEIDRLSGEYDILIIQSAGNLKTSRAAPRPGIAELIGGGRAYPDYLGEPTCRVANPAQSFQALTVGSVAYGAFESIGWHSFASRPGEPSAFSRAGLGIWDTIKPEVVEKGGDCMRTTGNPPAVSTPDSAREYYPELVRSTRDGGPAFDRDDIGTSYAAPKVTRIAARLQALLPDEPCLLYRGLIVQSARWPDWASALTREQQAALLKRIGFGIPDMGRATENTHHRTTFITHGEREIGAGECHIYQVPIPHQLRRAGEEYDIRVEITLSYAAEPRRTRRTPRGYLSVWLDWLSNRKGESLDAFLTRALKSDENAIREGSSFGWVIESRGQWGQIPDIRRNVGTVQKDWTVVKSYDLPEDLCIAVRGHRGWSRDPEAAARYALVASFEIVGQEIPIYEPLRAAVHELQAEVEAEVQAETAIEV
ncbi:MAG TPA: S8 family peptidase, partial [Pirellulales bacterium]|nr:S8 family peptidase [Pirellulales bacterium]